MLNDFRNAFRSLVHPGARAFAAVSVAVLALGIGGATAIFSVVDAVVLRGLPFDEHGRLAVVLEHDTRRPETFGQGSTTTQTYCDWRSMQQSFDGLAIAARGRFRVLNEGGEPDYASSQRVSAEFFQVLRVAPILGSTFTRQNENPGQHRVVVLGYGFWQRRFGGARDVVGKTIQLNEEPWTITGVMPAGFSYPVADEKPTDVYAPVVFTETAKSRERAGRSFSYTAIGRLKRRVSLAQAQDQMKRVAAQLEKQYPKWSGGRTVRVVSLQEHLVGSVRPWMLMLLSAVGLLLLIACANVANLMLARATVRTREMNIRSALGATRWHLVRALMAESLLISMTAALAGITLAANVVPILRLWLPTGLPRVASIGVDLRVLFAAIGAALGTALAFGLVPAIQGTRTDLAAALNDDGRANTAGAGKQRLRSALVVVEVALAFVLLAGSGVFMASFTRLVSIDVGFDYHDVLTLDAGPRVKPGTDPKVAEKEGAAYVERMLGVVRGVPGITGVAAVSGGLPLTGSWNRTDVALPGGAEFKDLDDEIDIRVVSPDYLKLMRIPLVRGRAFKNDDREGGLPVVLVNEAAARRYWRGKDALEERVTLDKVERVVVGIVGNIRHLGPETPPRPECYVPMSQAGMYGGGTFVLRTAGDPLKKLKAVKAAMWSVDPDLRFAADTYTLEGYMDRLIAQRRFLMALLSVFGLLGVGIAAAGIYGVLAYLVAQRTSEIGVRVALGATPQRIVATVVARSVALVGAGLAAGTAASLYLAAGIRAFLFNVEPTDMQVMTLAAAAIVVTGLVASFAPARRAAMVDPLVAMRRNW